MKTTFLSVVRSHYAHLKTDGLVPSSNRFTPLRYLTAVLLLLALGIGNAWAHSTHYGKAVLSNATGNGTVYLSTSGTENEGNPTQSNAGTKNGTSTKTWNCGGSSGADQPTYYARGTANPGYYYAGYATSATAISYTTANNFQWKPTKATATGSGSPTTSTVYGYFLEITINNPAAVTINATDNASNSEANKGTITFTTKGDAWNDFSTASPVTSAATGYGTFTFARGTATNGNAEVNYTFVGDGTYGGRNKPASDRNRTSSATVTLTSAVGNNSGSCTITARFPDITVGTGSGEEMYTTNAVPQTATATFPVEYADDELDFTASFGTVTNGGEWTVNEIVHNAGTVTITYTFDNQRSADASGEMTHTAVLTLKANDNAGGKSNTVTLTAYSKKVATSDAVVINGASETEYATFAEAIAAANLLNTNPTVKLLRNVEGLGTSLEIKKPMTLDLASFLVRGSADKLLNINAATAALTIMDSKTGGKIMVENSSADMLQAVSVTKGTLVVSSGTIEANNTGAGNAAVVVVNSGARLAFTGGTLNATAATAGAYGIRSTTEPEAAADVMVTLGGGSVNATAPRKAVGVFCTSASVPELIDPTASAHVAVDGVTVNVEAAGTNDAYAIQTEEGVFLLVNSGNFNAAAAGQNAFALHNAGYTAVLGGTFTAEAGTTIARGINLAGGVVAVKAGSFAASAATDQADGAYIASGAKLLAYGGSFAGKLTAAAASKWATGAHVMSGGALDAQGGSFLGEIAKADLAAEQNSFGVGVYADTGASVTMANAALRAQTDNTNLNGAYALYTKTANALGLTRCTLEAQSASSKAYGVDVEGETPLSFNNCTIRATAAVNNSYGIYQNVAASTIDENNSAFTVTSNEKYAYGVYLNNGSMTANGTTFNVETKQTSAAVADCYLRGIYVAKGKGIRLDNCVINAKGATAYSNNGYGLYIEGTAEVTNTDVSVSGINSGAYAIVNTANTTAVNIWSGKFKATATATAVPTNATAAADKQYFYGGYFNANNNLAKYLPADYAVETLTTGSEYDAGYNYTVGPTKIIADPVCKINSLDFGTLEEALEYANKNSATVMTIYMVKDYTLPAGNYTLPAKATLLVPYKTGTGAGATTAIGSGGSSYVTTNTTPSRYRKLTFAGGVNMSVLGTIEVSGQKFLTSSNATGIPTGPYGQLVLEENAHIDLESQSNLIAWGYVTGNGSINAKKNATIYETFQLLDMKGGGVTSQLVNDSRNPQIFPITHYAYQNVEAAITYRPGSRAVGWTGASIQSSNQTANDVMMVGNMTSGALFLMADEGESSDTWVRKKYDPVTDRVEYTLNNTATLGNINVDLSSINLASSKYILPIASNMTVTMKYGTMTITQNSYFMPGSVLNIEKEATLTIPSGKALYFVDKAQWVKGYAPAQYVCVTPYSPSFNNGAGGLGSSYSARKAMTSNNSTLQPAELFVHGNIEVNGALYTTVSGANIHSTNSDAGTILFNSIAANKDFCQLNSTCGEGAGGPGGSPGGSKCGTLAKLVCTTGICDCYYWNWNTWPCTSAQLRNSDGSFTSSVSGGAGTYVYKNGAWTKVAKEGCFTTETDGLGKHYYANPSDIVEVTRNSDNSYRDTESGLRRFIWDANCEWWEVETTPTAEGYYKAIKADHNDKYNYYEYDSTNDYWKVKTITVTWSINGKISTYTIGYGTKPKYFGTTPAKDAIATEYYIWKGWTKDSEEGTFFAKDADLEEATSEVTYYVAFEPVKYQYTITLANYDGVVLEAKRWNAGDAPAYAKTPTKPSSVSIDYTFDGWATTKNGAKAFEIDGLPGATAAATYYAHYAESDRKYTVTFINNGVVYMTQDVAYNSTPAAPEVEPTRPNDAYYTYTFDAWSPAMAPVKGNQTYTANYIYEKKVPKYTIVFNNKDGKPLFSQDLEEGKTPVYVGKEPVYNPADGVIYTFTGWDPAIVPAIDDVVYTAQYKSAYDVKDGTKTITANSAVTSTIVHTDGSLIVNSGKTLTTTDLILEATHDQSGELTINGTIASENVYFDLILNTKLRHWHTFTVPFEVDLNLHPILADGVSMPLGVQYDIVYYDGEVRAAQGKSNDCWKYVEDDANWILTPGKAYMIVFGRDVDVVRFTKKDGALTAYTGAVPVAENHSDRAGGTDGGWNGIGNPRAFHAKLNAPGVDLCQVHDGGEIGKDGYHVYDMAGKFVVGKAAFIQVGETPSIVVNKASSDDPYIAAQAPRRVRMQSEKERFDIRITSVAGETEDRLIILAEEGKADCYVVLSDLAKAGVSPLRAQMWVSRYGEKLCKNTATLDNNRAEYPLGISVPATGEYTITVNGEGTETNGAQLYLTLDGKPVWNLSYADYTATLEKGTTDRYGLRLVRNASQIATGIDEAVVDAEGNTRKVLINNQVFVIRGENVYTMDGQLVK